MRSVHRPRLPPTIDGDADRRSACRSWNGWGWKRETQSTAFLSTPGSEAVYSCEEITKASVASIRRRSDSAPAGKPVSLCASALYEGHSKSAIVPWSTVPPLLSIVATASAASCVLKEPARREAEKTRKEMGSRASATITVTSSRLDRSPAYSR